MKTNYNKGDLLKKWDKDIYRCNACVGKNGGPYNYSAYCKGYFFAAKSVAEKVVAEGRNFDISIYPTFYLYRHAVELGLKSAWAANSHMDNVECDSIKDHKLGEIWKKLRPKLVALEKIENETIELMDDIIKDVCEFDQSAEEFRFPESLNHEPYLQDKSHINVVALYETMEVAENIIEYWFFSFNRIFGSKEVTPRAEPLES